MAKGNHSFTEQEIRKRFGAIIGHTVARSIPPAFSPRRRHPATRDASLQSSSSRCLAILQTPIAVPISSSTGDHGR